MVLYILILYGAFSLLFILITGLFFSRIIKRRPLPPMLFEKPALQKDVSPESEVLKRSRSRIPLAKAKAASSMPALSFSREIAEGM